MAFRRYLEPKIPEENDPVLLGSYILEGSKAGAAAAAVWAAHRTVPLNVTGYGRVIGRGIEGAHHFYESLKKTEPMEVGMFDRRPLTSILENSARYCPLNTGSRFSKKALTPSM